MKIDNQNPLIQTGQTPPRQPAQKAPATQAGQPDAHRASTTHLSLGAADVSQDIDSARVDEIRDAIREGRLEIRADRIADGLIDSVRDMLGDSEA